MLRSIIDNHQELYQLLQAQRSSTASNSLDKLSRLTMTEIDPICDFLSFFKNLTTSVEGDQEVTPYKYWPSLREIEIKQ